MATGRTRLLVSPFTLCCSILTRSRDSVGSFLRRRNYSVVAETIEKGKNYQRRIDLAAAYRGFEKYGFHEGVCNHLSAIAPASNGQGEVMLITPYGFHWSEVDKGLEFAYLRPVKIITSNLRPGTLQCLWAAFTTKTTGSPNGVTRKGIGH